MLRRSLFLLLALAALSGCATQKPVGDDLNPTKIEEVELDPVLIKATVKDGDVQGSELVDSGTAFKAGNRAFKKKDYKEAIQHFAVILENFKESNYYLPSLYNTALSLERLDRWEESLSAYNTLIEAFPGKEAATDALFRSSVCAHELKRYEDVLTILTRLEKRTGLSIYDNVELEARRGNALLEMNRLTEAEEAYRRAIKLHQRAPAEIALPDDQFFVVAAHFGVSQVYHKLFRDVRFRLPVERMEKDIEDKSQLFSQAQSGYIRTIKRGNPYWTTAARYQIARMYEEFYIDLLNAEFPELSDEEANLYFDELRKNIRPFMKRAMRYYEKTITLSERAGVDNEHTQKTQEALERLKRYISDPELQRRDEERIRSGKSLKAIGLVPPEDERTTPAGEPGEDKDKNKDDEEAPETPTSSNPSPAHREPGHVAG